MALNKADFPFYTSSATNINITGPGVWFVYGGTASTVVLPPRAGIPNSDLAIYRIVVAPTAAPVTVSRSSADTIAVGGVTTATSFILNPGESVDMIHSGLTWVPLFGAIPPAMFRKVAPMQTGTTFTLDRSASLFVFTGTAAAAWTLPVLSLNKGLDYTLHNRGTAAITLSPNGADTLTLGAVTASSVVIAPGQIVRVVNDGTTWIVENRPVRRLRSGKYYGIPNVAFNNTGLPTADRLRVVPFVVPESGVYDRIASEVITGAAATLLRWGIYRDGGGYPGALILDSGAVGDASTAGVKEATIAANLVGGERVWLGVAAQGGNPTMRTLAGSISLPDVGIDTADIVTFSGIAVGYFTSAAAALPATFTAGAGVQNTAPGIWLRKA
ncbi:hypothetical protein ASG84_12720 [Rhodococcus sp. Leaf278]|uniref:hypothetical protein n=1 Tax=Rhodococcus sp. Leaf278 TaxID=1736319 RepID=UPI00070AEA2C|nr:hypothetical protein [Rhodococcus sp. Leaf278]KQU44181.1 hypothetical protein ASG84_12720 [Rhodococcus sp. Leaf278]